MIKFDCEKCHDTGYISYNVPLGNKMYGKLYPCECRIAEHVQRLQAVWKLTDKEAAYTLDGLQPTGGDTDRVVSAARWMIENQRGILTLWGNYGTGKSHAGIAMANAIARLGEVAYYLNFADLLDWIRDGFNNKSDSAAARFDKLIGARLVVIDEADKISPTDWAVEFRTRFFDRRHRSATDGETGLVVIMNKSPKAYFPGWIYSRLKGGKIIRNGDQDMREAATQLELMKT